MISIIIPTLNEESIIELTLRNISMHIQNTPHEIIVSDGGSRDNTVTIAKKFALVVNSEKGKAIQLNNGVKRSSGDILFFVQSDAMLPDGTLDIIESKIYKQGYDGGGFSNVFSEHNKKIKTLSRVLNMRFRTNDNSRNLVFFGDNGIFCKREVFDKLGGFKIIPIMEDYDFSKRMKSSFRSVRILEPKLIMSPRRFVKNGFMKTCLQWIIIRRLYEIGVSPYFLVKMYRDVR